jgi:toxin ParE1/3/4
MRYEFHPDALIELEQTARYYRAREPGLDIRFIDVVEETIGRILEAPNRWRIVDEDVRRCLTRIFPHGILYTIEQDHNPHPGDHALQPRARLLEIPARRKSAVTCDL